MKKWIPVFLLLVLNISILVAQDPFNTPSVLPGADANMSQAVVFADYDNDGWIDLYLTKSDDGNGTKYLNYLFHNSSGTLSQITITGMTDILAASGSASWADIDHDGFLDLYAAVAQNGYSGSPAPNNLFLNSGTGSFTDLTGNSAYGTIVTDVEDSRHVGWGDYNNDGYPDVFIDNGAIGLFGPTKGANSFYSNNGDGTYSKKTSTQIGNIISTSTSYKTFGSGFGWSDFDGDGYLDIFNASGGGNLNYLWHNNSTTGQFDDVTPTMMQPSNTSFIACSWGDYDNDGDPDLYASNTIDGSISHNFLYKNNSTPGVVSFTDMTGVGTIVTDAYHTQGGAWGDIDNDGDLDMFTSNKQNSSVVPPSVLYGNNGAASSYSFTKLHDYFDPADGVSAYNGRGAALADLNNDGFLDLVVARAGNPELYMNKAANGNTFSVIKLRGSGTTNTHGLGSRVFVRANIPEQTTSTLQMREVSGQTGGGGQSSLRTHFGLGTASSIDTIRVEWLNSTSGGAYTENIYSNMPTGKFMVFTQGTAFTGTASVIPAQSFMYLVGSTGAAVDFTSNTATTAGTLTITRTNSNPGSVGYSGTATAPDASTITPNSVAAERYWTIAETGLTGKFTCEVYLDITGLTGITNPDRLVILKRANNTAAWTPLNSLRIGNTLYSNASVSSFSEFAIGYNTADQSLPVELVSFNATRRDNSVSLQWQTASELENVGFILERSMSQDGDFIEIASYRTDDALRGQGNSSRAHSYVYMDHMVNGGSDYFYRLSDISIDGLRAYHGIVEAAAVTVINGFVLHPAYPNPFNPSTKIKLEVAEPDNKIVLEIYNALGERIQTLYSGTLSRGVHAFSWDGTNSRGAAQASGIYILRAQSGVHTETQKMLLVR